MYWLPRRISTQKWAKKGKRAVRLAKFKKVSRSWRPEDKNGNEVCARLLNEEVGRSVPHTIILIADTYVVDSYQTLQRDPR